MVEGDSDTEKVACTGANYTQSGDQGSRIRRDPSFSRWCDEDGKVLFDNNQLGNADANVEEDSDFELPLLRQGEKKKVLNTDRSHNTKFQQISTHFKGGDTMDNASIHVEGNGNEKFAPFDIENNGTMKETNSVDGSNFMHEHRPLPPNMKNTVSVANVLKTLFFILVWYTFSLFLTL